VTAQKDPPRALRLTQHEAMYRAGTCQRPIHPDRVSPGVHGYSRVPAVRITVTGADDAGADMPRGDGDVVVAESLRCGVEARAYRSGTFLFDFSGWARAPIILVPGYTEPSDGPPYTLPPATLNAQRRAEEAAALRISVLNAHQLCLAIAAAQLQHPFDGPGDPVTTSSALAHLQLPDRLLVDSSDDAPRPGSSHRPAPISHEIVRRSFSILGLALDSPNAALVGWLDGFSRALGLARSRSYGEAVVLGWTVCEQLVSTMWEQYLQSLDAAKPGRVPSSRKGKLSAPGFTASNMVEALEFAGVVDFETYRRLEIGRKSRNAWVHKMRTPHLSELMACMDAAAALLERSAGFPVRVPYSLGRNAVPTYSVANVPADLLVRARQTE
jgi:hypothetical protein